MKDWKWWHWALAGLVLWGMIMSLRASRPQPPEAPMATVRDLPPGATAAAPLPAAPDALPIYSLKDQPCGEDAAYALVWREARRRIVNADRSVFRKGIYREGFTTASEGLVYARTDTIYFEFAGAINHLDQRYASVRSYYTARLACVGTRWQLASFRIGRSEPWRP